MIDRNSIWHIADGRAIRIADMKNGHLLNAIRYIKQRMDGDVFLAISGSLGDYYDAMKKEARRRKLRLLRPSDPPRPISKYKDELMPTYDYQPIRVPIRWGDYEEMMDLYRSVSNQTARNKAARKKPAPKPVPLGDLLEGAGMEPVTRALEFLK